MESTAITFDQLPHVVGGLSEKLDRVLELLEKVGIANPFTASFMPLVKNMSPSRKLS